jgi:hypothetical protein
MGTGQDEENLIWGISQDLYEGKIRSLVEAENQDKIVAIDVESGEFELGEDTIVACDRLLERLPEAVIWR